MAAVKPSPFADAAIVLLTALAHAGVGWLALSLQIPPTRAAVVFPSAGIALAAALVYGRPALLGAGLGAGALVLGAGLARGDVTPVWAAVAVVAGVGAALQAALGRWLVRSFVGQPLVLDEPRDLLRFALLAGPLASVVSATVSTLALVAGGYVAPAQATSNAVAWWIGDTLGVLIGAPIVLALIGRPRLDWAPRVRVVALPMLVALVLLALAARTVLVSHAERVRTTFERDAWSLADRLDTELRRVQDALLALHGALDGRPAPQPDEFARLVRPWLDQQPFIVALGYSERIDPADVAAFEARVRAEGPVDDYRVFDRADGDPTPSRHGVVAIRHVEPLAANRAALGVNALSIPAARRAIERAAATGETAATAGFRLTQATGNETGIVLYRALYDGQPRDDGERRAAFRGVVFLTLRLDAMVSALFRTAPAYLSWCLIDDDPGAERPRLAGPVGCEAAAPAPLAFERRRAIQPRVLSWRVETRWEAVPGLGDGGGWLFSLTGVAATALLGALLLLVSGRQRRIEAAVAARTAALQRASAALRDSEARLRSIVDHAPIGVFYADPEGRLRSVNPALRAMTGPVDRGDDAPRGGLQALVHPDDRPAVQALIERLQAPGVPPVRARLRLLGPQQQEVPVQLTMSALREPGGGVRRLIGVVEDIGEHERLLASERAREQAEAASRAKNEFVGRMSHELRTPLNAMLGFAQLLGRDRAPPLAPHQQRWAGQIQDAGWHLLNMINDTLDLSMVESGALRLQPRALDAGALVAACLPLVSAAAQRQQVTLEPPEVAPGTPPLRGDETRVRQILTNLLSNAVKYNVAGGRVSIAVAAADGAAVEIAVQDTGLGLTPAQADALFQPFNRLGREGSGVEGTGIGLVLSRRLAELMGGALTLRPQPRAGACFVLRLPAAAPDDGQRPPVGRDASDEDVAALYARRRVHYVEDNETNVVLMQGMLAQRPQIALSVSVTGAEAIAHIQENLPDLVLLDMHLPDIDGLALLRRLKADPRTEGVPVLVLSADATADRVERAIAEGAAGYLLKPLDLGTLLDTVDGFLSQADTRWG